MKGWLVGWLVGCLAGRWRKDNLRRTKKDRRMCIVVFFYWAWTWCHFFIRCHFPSSLTKVTSGVVSGVDEPGSNPEPYPSFFSGVGGWVKTLAELGCWMAVGEVRRWMQVLNLKVLCCCGKCLGAPPCIIGKRSSNHGGWWRHWGSSAEW